MPFYAIITRKKKPKGGQKLRNCHAEPTLRQTQFDTKILRLRKSDKKRESVDLSAPKSLYRKYHHREFSLPGVRSEKSNVANIRGGKRGKSDAENEGERVRTSSLMVRKM